SYHDRLLGAGQHLFDALLEIGLHVAIEPGVTVDQLLNFRQRLVVVDLGIDADPVLREIDAVWLIAGDGAPDVGAAVADPGNGNQLTTGLLRDPDHLRVGGAGSGHPVHQEIPLLEVRQQGLPEPRVHHHAGQHDDADRDERRTWGADDPGKQRFVRVLQPSRKWGFATLQG